MQILPHVYTNISEIFKKDNLYKIDTGGGKLKKETENENELLENKIKVNSNDSISFSYNEKNILNEEKAFGIEDNEKGTLSTFYYDYYKEIMKSTEYKPN